MFKKLLSLLTVTALSLSVSAQDVALNPDHPQSYVVEKGDTLWDISARFLTSPWLWPEVWQANPQIDNPHLIFPGDEINLVYVEGQPRLRLERADQSTVVWSPHIREEAVHSAVKSIPLKEISHLLTRNRLLGEEEVKNQAYVVAIQEDRLRGTLQDTIYVRNLEGAPGQTFAVMRPGNVYREVPDRSTWAGGAPGGIVSEKWQFSGGKTLSGKLSRMWDEAQWGYEGESEILGYELMEIGRAKVLKSGDPSSLQVLTQDMEVNEGDLILPLFETPFEPVFFPRAPEHVPPKMRVLAIGQALFGVGTNQVVAISGGEREGLKPGYVFSAHNPERLIKDRVKYAHNDLRTAFHPHEDDVTIPEEYHGHVMIFMTFDRISYGLVMRAIAPIRLYDVLRAP